MQHFEKAGLSICKSLIGRDQVFEWASVLCWLTTLALYLIYIHMSLLCIWFSYKSYIHTDYLKANIVDFNCTEGIQLRTWKYHETFHSPALRMTLDWNDHSHWIGANVRFTGAMFPLTTTAMYRHSGLGRKRRNNYSFHGSCIRDSLHIIVF